MKNMFEMLETLEKNYEERRKKMYARYEDTERGVSFIRGYKNAITDLRKMMYGDCPKFYFTFGSDPAFPFGRNEYVVVHAANMGEAVHKFQREYPNRRGSNLVNCAFWYDEEEWNSRTKQYYPNTEPAEVIY